MVVSIDTPYRVINASESYLGYTEVVLDALHQVLDLWSISVRGFRSRRIMAHAGEYWPHVYALRSALCCQLLR